MALTGAFRNKAQARRLFETQGMTRTNTDPHTGREYWAYGDGTDSMVDHSATITWVGRVYMVTDFGRKEVA